MLSKEKIKNLPYEGHYVGDIRTIATEALSNYNSDKAEGERKND